MVARAPRNKRPALPIAWRKMEQIDFSELLDALAELKGERVSVLVAARSGGPDPVVVLIGTAGAVEMSSDDEGDGERGVAFIPVEESAAAMGRQGLYVKAADLGGATHLAGRLTINLSEVTIEIEPT